MPRRANDPDAAGQPAAIRRAPFGDRPTVGARGLRTQQRVLDAALQAFDEAGYDRTTLDRIAELAGCSRITIYQYFSGKEDVFRHLAAQVARQLRASLESLAPVTSDAQGHAALRSWIERYADIRSRYEPVLRASDAAAASDALLAGGVARTVERHVGIFEARLGAGDLPPRLLDPTVALLLTGVDRALGLAAMLRSASPEPFARDRVQLAIADVVHRALFGLRGDVNVHDPVGARPPTLRLGAVMSGMFDRVETLEMEAKRPARRALAAMLAVGDDVVGRRGYRGIRVDEIIEAAVVSRGSFYTYFENIDDFLRVVAVRAVRDVSAVLDDLPAVPTRASLRRWLHRYNDVHSAKGAMIRVWVEAVEERLQDERAAVFDWGRRRLVHLLAGREFGDVDIEALVLLAIVEVFGSAPRTTAELDAAMLVLERGFLGHAR